MEPSSESVVVKCLTDDKQLAGIAARSAALSIARAIVGQNSGQAHRARKILRSLFGLGSINLSEIDHLEWKLRRDICVLILGVNCSKCPDSWIRDAFEQVQGKAGLQWFFEGIPDALDAIPE